MASTADPITTPPPAATLFKKRKPPPSQIRKRLSPPPTTTIKRSASSETSSDSASDADDTRRHIKRRKTAGIAATTNATGNQRREEQDRAEEFAADTKASIAVTDDATRRSDWYENDAGSTKPPTTTTTTTTPATHTNKSLLSTTRALPSTSVTSTDKATEKSEKAKSMGPKKAPTNVRTIIVTDFAPDVCKDYKQTGFCGFGDSCKFLHAREDYKQGWELDREWDVAGKTKDKKGKSGVTVGSRALHTSGGVDMDADEADEEMLENIPFACVICKEGYKSPIVTKCGHYFCEACALKRYRKSPNCAVCGMGTGGVFNGAKGLKRLLERKRERERRRREEDGEEGEEGGGEGIDAQGANQSS